VIKHREENRTQPHAVGGGAAEHGEKGRDLQPPQRRDHAEGKERGETEQRKEHIESAAPDRSQPPPDGAQRIEHERERGAEKACRKQRPRLIGDGEAHPKSRAKKPPDAAGSSA
jgi:hypothetical protein